MSKLTKSAIVIMIAFCVLAMFLADDGATSSDTSGEAEAVPADIEAVVEVEKPVATAPKPVRPRKADITNSAREARARRDHERELRSAQQLDAEPPKTDAVSVRTVSDD